MKHVPLNDSYKWARSEVFSWAVGNYDDTGCHIRMQCGLITLYLADNFFGCDSYSLQVF